MKRAETVAELKALSPLFLTEASLRRGQAFRPDPTDVIISPYAKCGTTWMSQIVHGLRSGGAMDFDEITAVVPWLELAHDMGGSLSAPQVAAPRLFKSHLGQNAAPRGGRYIVVLREPVAAMVSLWRFFEGWWFEPGRISLADFAQYYLDRAGGGWWGHAASWWRARQRDEVLLFTYEQMTRDLGGVVGRVADFIGVKDAKTRAIATRQAGFDFMKRHARQFDDHLVRAARDAAMGLPPGGTATKIDRGQAGAAVPDAIRAAFAARWSETLGREFGLGSYGALDAALRDAAQARAQP